MYQASVS